MQALNPDVTHNFLPKCYSIEHTASAVFIAILHGLVNHISLVFSNARRVLS